MKLEQKMTRKSNFLAGARTEGQEGKVKRFWNIASTDEDSGEIILYGDVMSQKPRSFWTGEERPGLYITPEGFLEDLAVVKGKKNITIKINSCGGDLYTGIAIHNAIKALSGHKTVIVEGIAASAASVIACAGDEVQVYPGSMIMIHGVSAFLYDYCEMADLEKLMAQFEASENAIAQIYHSKTGREVDELRQLMRQETWFIGEEAVENRFADKLIEEETVEAALSADHKILMVAGVQHNAESFRNIPGNIRVSNRIQSQEGIGHKEKSLKNNTDMQKSEGKKMTKEELKNEYPELIAQITSEAENVARQAERQRIQDIESIQASVGDINLVNEAKYGENCCTAEQLAFRAMKAQAAAGSARVNDMMADSASSGTEQVNAAPTGGEENKQQEVDSFMALYNKTKGRNNDGKKAE